MRILLTNNAIAERTGSELYLCEVAEELQARGHEPMCFSLNLGPLAERLRALGILVTDDLRALPEVPEVIHGQHFIETTLAAMTYRKVPVISFCHGPEAWQEMGCQLPNVVRWVAVDQACRRRLIEDEGIDAEKLTMLLNHFDERKFAARSPLPAKPRRALIMSNYLHPTHPAVAAISEACVVRGIELTMAGANLGGVVENMGDFLAQFDLVFAKARTAIEALAVGCAVLPVDYFGAGRMVRSEIFDELRPFNFGYQSMTFPLDADYLGKEIDRYDAEDAAFVFKRIREEATLEKTMQSLLALYQEAAEQRSSLMEYDPSVAAADFMRFQLYLSKMPMGQLRQTPKVPLRLPKYPILPGELADCWRKLVIPHQKNTVSRAKAQQHIDRLKNKIATLKEQNIRLKTRLDNVRKTKPRLSIFQRVRSLFRQTPSN